MDPVISIVLPTYNRAKYLQQALDSILAQTEKNWELIIVDDGSTDNTPEIAVEYAARDERIRVISNRENEKLPESLNIGFRQARGVFLTWTSDDNMYKPAALKVMREYLENHSIDMVFAGYDEMDANGRIVCSVSSYRPPAALAFECNVGACFMYTKKIADKVGEYDKNLFCGEDYDYWCRIALAGAVAYLPDNLYIYRRHRDALTTVKQALLSKNTRIIQLKYYEKLLEKYKGGYWRQAKLFYNLYRTGVIKNIPRKYYLSVLILRLLKLLINYFCMFIWDKRTRKNVRSVIRGKLLLP
jgi:glycosyltransferase involved in cell wall biosynthesis